MNSKRAAQITDPEDQEIDEKDPGLVEYFLTRHGFLRGSVPNRAEWVYRKYRRWLERENLADSIPPLAYRDFIDRIRSEPLSFTVEPWARGWKVFHVHGNKHLVPPTRGRQ